MSIADKYSWKLHAWALFSNHYHFIASAPEDASTLSKLTRDLHSESARMVNEFDGAQGRQVWFQYRDTGLTFQKSYLARLNYVIQNPVKHGLVRNAVDYPWSSAAWFESAAQRSFVKTVLSMPCDSVKVDDDFAPILE